MAEQIEPVYRAIGTRIETVRETLGWNQQQLADKVGLCRTSLSKIESGKERVTLHGFAAIAAAFGMSPKQLLRGVWT